MTDAALPAGAPAPDFTLPATPDQRISLSELRGRPVILAFYPADWSPVCGDQMGLYNAVLPEFHAAGAELLGISVDGPWCHAAFAADRKLHFPLLAPGRAPLHAAHQDIHGPGDVVALGRHVADAAQARPAHRADEARGEDQAPAGQVDPGIEMADSRIVGQQRDDHHRWIRRQPTPEELAHRLEVPMRALRLALTARRFG